MIWVFLPAVEIVTTAFIYKSPFLLQRAFILLFITLTVACALLRPYKHRAANISGIALPALWAAAVAVWIVPNKPQSIKFADALSCLLLSLPHCVFYGYIVYRLGKLVKQHCCKSKTQEVEETVDEVLPCRPAYTTDYSQLIEVSTQDCND